MADENTEGKKITVRLPSMPKINPWIIVTVILLVVCLVLIVQPGLFGLGVTGQVTATGGLTAQQAGDKAVEYINNNLIQTGEFTFVSAEEMSGIYKVITSYRGTEIDVYITKDGKHLLITGQGGGVFDTSIPVTTTTTTQPQELNIDEEDLREFIDCLKDSGFEIYGANWCGWTKKLVTMLGGFDMVEPIYVECTEQKEECDNAGVTGYPTIIINGKRYQGQITFKAFSDATSCEIPSGAEVEQGNPSSTGGCG